MWTREDMRLATRMKHLKLEDLKKNIVKYEQDILLNDRIKRQTCKFCYYLNNKTGTDASANYTCKACDKTFIHTNGNTPNFCMTCAQKIGICIECGSIMTM